MLFLSVVLLSKKLVVDYFLTFLFIVSSIQKNRLISKGALNKSRLLK